MFQCTTCNKSFANKQVLQRHNNTPSHVMRVTYLNTLHECRCGKSFQHRSGLYRHKKSCDYEPPQIRDDETTGYEQIIAHQQQINELQQQQINELQQQQINDLKQQMNYLLVSSTSAPSQAIVPVQPQTQLQLPSQAIVPVQSQSQQQSQPQSQQLQPRSQSEPLPPSQPQTINNNQSQNTINSHNKNTTNNNININIQSFGNENLDYLNDSTIEGCINRVYDSIPRLIKTIHFHPKHPENHNIKVTNKKLPHATYLDDDKEWKLMNKDDAIHTMVETGYSILDSKFKEDPSKFTEERRRHYRRFQENYDNEDKATMKRIKNDVEMVLYNGTKEIMKKS
jgi:hypothetical protein